MYISDIYIYLGVALGVIATTTVVLAVWCSWRED